MTLKIPGSNRLSEKSVGHIGIKIVRNIVKVVNIWAKKSIQTCPLSLFHVIRGPGQTRPLKYTVSIRSPALKSGSPVGGNRTLRSGFLRYSCHMMKNKNRWREFILTCRCTCDTFKNVRNLRLSTVNWPSPKCWWAIYSDITTKKSLKTSDWLIQNKNSMEFRFSTGFLTELYTSLESQKGPQPRPKEAATTAKNIQICLLWFFPCKGRVAKYKITLSWTRLLEKS